MASGPGLRAPQQKAPAPPPARKQVAAAPTVDERAGRLKARTEALIGLAQIGAFMATVRGDFADVGAINQYGMEAATEVAEVGEEVEWLGNTLDMLAVAGPYTKLLTVMLPFGLQLAANRGKLDWRLAQNLGVVDPVILAERAKAEIREMAERQAMLAEQQAMQHAQEQRAREQAQREAMYGQAANGPSAAAG